LKRKKEPSSIQEILDQLRQETQLGRHLELAQIWSRWPEIAGPRLMEHGRPHGIRDMVLYVEADSPVWMHRFAYRKWSLLRRINRMAGHELVSDIFLVLSQDGEEGQSQDGV
jgi:predicted nucleic acid-binding Zn ribbon protein